MKVRLVAYRLPETTSTTEEAFELELEKAPNVALNFRFTDIKNPESRKGSYSQTFKLPFTNANNSFFQNWFNVNLDTLVFSTKRKFSATLFIGTVPQFDGYIQLKAVYQKAKRYEVVLMSNTSDLFSVIGDKKLRDVFLNDDGSWSDELNHTFTSTNVKESWDGSSSSFVNPSGVSLRDADAGVQKIVYPLTATRKNFFFKDGSNTLLDMSQADVDAVEADWDDGMGIYALWDQAVNIDQLRPAVQIKTLFTLIMARAGFSYTSEFIDGDYFGKLFMTLGNKLGTSILPTPTTTTPSEGGYLTAKKESASGGWIEGTSAGDISYPFFANFTVGCANASTVDPPTPVLFEANDEVDDPSNAWNNSTIITRQSGSHNWVRLSGEAQVRNVQGMCGGSFQVEVLVCDADTGESLYTGAYIQLNGSNGTSNQFWAIDVALSPAPVGSNLCFKFAPPALRKGLPLTPTPRLRMNGEDFTTNINGATVVGVYSLIRSYWIPYNPSQYDKEVLIPSCVDEELTQKSFLKDIIQRFNLMVVSDPNDPTNILLEPYNTFFTLGTIKDWSEKLDVSKEVIVKDTASMQKKIVNLTDLEDVDVMNKTIKDYAPTLNVYGKYYNDAYGGGNDFASGELKNESIFSPYINQKVFKNSADQEETELANVAIHYEISYKAADYGVEPTLEETKPKLFYYCGTPTTIRDNSGTTKTIYLHNINPLTGVVTAHNLTQYPVCTPFDITPDASTDTYTLTASNKSLYWNFAPPQCGEVTIFNYNPATSPNWQDNTLFFLYWKKYLDSIYSTEARIMEAYFDLNEVDILNFKFNDEIFVKDSWWRIQTIENYQVGAKASTKVTLLKKIDDAVALPQDCEYVNSGNFYIFLTWCPSSDTGCTPVLTSPTYLGLYAPTACCEAAGGFSWTAATQYASQGLYPCVSNAGSLPTIMKTLDSPLSLFNTGTFKTMMTGKLGGFNLPFTVGGDRGKASRPLMPQFGDDMIIKYKNKILASPSVEGENHRMILLGNTTGTTRGYAYPENDKYADKIYLPNDSNVMISVKGITTIVGGTNATYVVGTTESFSYNTVFVVTGGGVSQIGTAGGVAEWSIKDPSLSTTSTIYITTNTTDANLEFALDDSQADTEKAWTLTVDITVQKLGNLSLPYGTNWAIWQEGNNIELMNYEYLIWN